jgi:hypothetical protein
MKAGIVFTGTGPILILTTYETFEDPKIVEKLAAKGINKYIASELPLEAVKKKYGNHYNVIMGDLKQTDDAGLWRQPNSGLFPPRGWYPMNRPLVLIVTRQPL